MPLTLHHFRKEARYLLPRWLPWIALLLLDLAVNLEWIAPLRSDHTPAWWIKCLPIAVWGLVFWLVTSDTPEDSPTNPNRFLATRPMLPHHYWGARLLILLLLFILPLTLQEALYLLISGRLWPEVWNGATHQTLIAFALYAWVLPFKNLWRGWQHLAALTALILSCLATLWIVDALAGEERLYFPATTRLHHAACLFSLALFAAVLTCLLAWKKWPLLSLPKRLTLFSCVSATAMVAAIFSPVQPASCKPSDQAAVDAMAPALSLKVRPTEIEFFHWPRNGSPSWASRVHPDFNGLPGPIQLESRTTSMQVVQDGQTCGVERLFLSRSTLFNRYYSSRFNGAGGSDRAIAALFPTGTLLTTGSPRTSYDRGMIASNRIISPLPDIHRPVTLSGEWEFDWLQWQMLTKMPLHSHATSASANGQWQILNVRLNQSAHGATKPGAVSIDLKSARRFPNATSLLPLKKWPDSLLTVLYAPDRRIGWVMPSEPTLETPRATLSHWRRSITTLTWHDILTYKDGSPATCDPAKLELWIIDQTLLGVSRWQWQPPPLRIADHLERRPDNFHFDHSQFYEGRELAALNQHLATLPSPRPNTSKNEVHQYLAELLIRINAIGYNTNSPDVKQRMREALLPIAQQHLDVLLDLPDSAFRGTRLIAEVVDQTLTDDHRDRLINQLPTKPQFAQLIMKRHWTPYVSRVAPELITNHGRIDRDLLKLLLTLDDSAIRARLVDEMRARPDAATFEQLIQTPALKPALDQVAADGFHKVCRMLQSYHEEDRLLIASRQGDPAALDLALLWAAMAGETGANRYNSHPTTLGYGLARTLGLISQDRNKRPPMAKLWPLFRGLRASDFRYLPTERRWETIHP